jgi:nucleoside-diphosphate-sugar epimerase
MSLSQPPLQEANVVVNLMGQQTPSFNFTLDEANVEGVRNIALAAKEAGVERFIHISAMSASADSSSAYSRSKAAGEAVSVHPCSLPPMPSIFHPMHPLGCARDLP